MVVGREPSADGGLNAKGGQDSSRHLQRVRVLRTTRPCNGRLAEAEQTELLERSAVVRVRREHPGRQGKVGRALCSKYCRNADRHDVLGFGIGKGLDHHAVDHAEHGRRRANPEGERQDDRQAEGGLPPHHARRVSEVLPDITQQVSGWRSRLRATSFGGRADGDRCRRMRLPQWRHVLREQVSLSELCERQARGIVFAGPARHQLAPAILEMLGKLFDDLLFARWRKAQRRQTWPHVFCPVTHVHLRSRVAQPRQTRPTSSAAGRGRACLGALAGKTGGDAHRASRPTCP